MLREDTFKLSLACDTVTNPKVDELKVRRCSAPIWDKSMFHI